MIKELLELSLSKKASDIIISAETFPSLKINWDVLPVERLGIISKEDSKKLVLSIMNKYQQEKFIKNMELDFSIWLWKVRFRVNAFMFKNWYWLVIRPIATEAPNFESLWLPDVVRKFTNKKNWIILITWSVWSGKSTTMVSLLNEINRKYHRHIITVEDPIEFVFKNDKSVIEQREVETNTLSFENWLKYALRQASDVIMIWEMRDLETFRLALRAAETGNLVLATLHTSWAARTVSRVIDMFPTWEKEQIKWQLAESLIWVVWQKLLKTSDWKGRVLAPEVLVNSSSIWNLIRKWDTHQIDGIIETWAREGMINMSRTLEKLYNEWKISEEVYNSEINNIWKSIW